MFLWLNHHHQRQRAGSEPPTVLGSRPRPPDSTPSASEAEAEAEDEAEEVRVSLHTKSLHTKCVVKRGHTTNHSLRSDTPPSSTPPGLPGGSLHAEALASTQPPPPASHDVAGTQLDCLESLLDSVLATLTIIQTSSTMPVVLSMHSRDALYVLNKMLHLDQPLTATAPAPQPALTRSEDRTLKSYAQAAKQSPAACKTAHTSKLSPASQPPHTLRWRGHPVPQSSKSMQHFIDYIEKQLDNPVSITGANVTRSGNIVIHTKAPYTATQLRDTLLHDEAKPLRRAAKFNHIPDFSAPSEVIPHLELDVPWHGVVLHDLPATTLLAAYAGAEGVESIWDALETETGLMETDIRDLRVLCHDDEAEGKQAIPPAPPLEAYQPLTPLFPFARFDLTA
ncbi:hypothetical protein BDZ97DRAFT_2078445 [Flammula alnicola]|nr:hypothetical protein BDZ97DRAFT_2078445 [Flammula alnicola]